MREVRIQDLKTGEIFRVNADRGLELTLSPRFVAILSGEKVSRDILRTSIKNYDMLRTVVG